MFCDKRLALRNHLSQAKYDHCYKPGQELQHLQGGAAEAPQSAAGPPTLSHIDPPDPYKLHFTVRPQIFDKQLMIIKKLYT